MGRYRKQSASPLDDMSSRKRLDDVQRERPADNDTKARKEYFREASCESFVAPQEEARAYHLHPGGQTGGVSSVAREGH